MPDVASLETPEHIEQELHDWVATCYADPLRFVLGAYDWPLKGELGPDIWQRDVLLELGAAVKARKFDGNTPVLPIRLAIASGHGIGKSALFAWIVDWLMSTRPDCQGTVTANTNDQLEAKTWAAVREWTALCITAHWFEINTAIMFRKGQRPTWKCEPQTCAEENSEAFAGQHAKNSTSFYLFDEASAIGDEIFRVAQGGLTDGEPMLLLGGNPTRNTGAFYEAVFGKQRDRYVTHVIDSRECKFANKAYITELLEDYGEESDFFRVRVRGLPPLANELQYIDGLRIAGAQQRIGLALPDDPLVAGVDVSGGGSAWTVCCFRRGIDGRSIPPLRITGEQTRDRNKVVAALALQFDNQPDLAAMFVDAAFGAPIVERLQMLGYTNVYEVNFGGASPDPHFANLRAYMWAKAKEWLAHGLIDPKDTRLATDLGGPGYHLNTKNQLVLEPKESMLKRGLATPDDGDGLALTFAFPVRPDAAKRLRAQWLPVPQSW